MKTPLLTKVKSNLFFHTLEYAEYGVEIYVTLDGESGMGSHVELNLDSGEAYAPYDAMNDEDAIYMGELLAQAAIDGNIQEVIDNNFNTYF